VQLVVELEWSVGDQRVVGRRAVVGGERPGFDVRAVEQDDRRLCDAAGRHGRAALGSAITTADAETEGQPNQYGCNYGNADDSLQVEVTVFDHNAASTYNAFFSGIKGATTVSGLGDKAFFDNDATMYVLAGSNLVQVNGLNTADECAALARPVVAAL
jgi:hypothetical protein